MKHTMESSFGSSISDEVIERQEKDNAEKVDKYLDRAYSTYCPGKEDLAEKQSFSEKYKKRIEKNLDQVQQVFSTVDELYSLAELYNNKNESKANILKTRAADYEADLLPLALGPNYFHDAPESGNLIDNLVGKDLELELAGKILLVKINTAVAKAEMNAKIGADKIKETILKSIQNL